MHRKYAELLDGFALPKALRPIFEKVVKDYFAQSCNEQVKNRTLLTKQLSEITNNIKKVQMNRAIDAIDDEIYQGAIAELTEKKVVFQKVCLGRRLQILQICKYSDSWVQNNTPRRVDLIFVL